MYGDRFLNFVVTARTLINLSDSISQCLDFLRECFILRCTFRMTLSELSAVRFYLDDTLFELSDIIWIFSVAQFGQIDRQLLYVFQSFGHLVPRGIQRFLYTGIESSDG